MYPSRNNCQIEARAAVTVLAGRVAGVCNSQACRLIAVSASEPSPYAGGWLDMDVAHIGKYAAGTEVLGVPIDAARSPARAGSRSGWLRAGYPGRVLNP